MSFQVIDIIGYFAAGLVFCSFYMKTMKALRVVAVAANVFSLVYALLNGTTPIVFLHLSLLPLNIYRLKQMQDLLSRLKRSTNSDYNFAALIPYMKMEKLDADVVVFKKGEAADKFYIIKDGRLKFEEIDKVVGPGQILGEIGIFSSDRLRTATAITSEPTTLYSITRETILQLHYQDPDFSLYLMRLIISRLQDNAKLMH
jgi:CRP/FNR family cyclic AMP-dependent transcriptional regulator